MADIGGKIYRDIRVSSQYVIQIGPEHIQEYLNLKGIKLPCEVKVGFNDPDGTYTELDPTNPLLVTCANYEQSTTEDDL